MRDLPAFGLALYTTSTPGTQGAPLSRHRSVHFQRCPAHAPQNSPRCGFSDGRCESPWLNGIQIGVP